MVKSKCNHNHQQIAMEKINSTIIKTWSSRATSKSLWSKIRVHYFNRWLALIVDEMGFHLISQFIKRSFSRHMMKELPSFFIFAIEIISNSPFITLESFPIISSGFLTWEITNTPVRTDVPEFPYLLRGSDISWFNLRPRIERYSPRLQLDSLLNTWNEEKSILPAKHIHLTPLLPYLPTWLWYGCKIFPFSSVKKNFTH